MRARTEPSISRPAWHGAVAAFKAASYTVCLTKLEGDNAGRPAALRARALLRLNRDADALAALVTAQNAPDDESVRGEHASLASIALLRLGRFAEARQAQADAREHLSTVTAWAVRAELRYHEATLHFAIGEHHRSYDIAQTSEKDIVGFYERASHDVVSVTMSRAAIMNARAVVDLSRGRYAPALKSLTDALRICRSDPKFDVGINARILSNVTSLMTEDCDRQAETLRLVLNANAEIVWTPELAHLQFCVLREIGYYFALIGDFEKAFDAYRTAASCSTSMMNKVLAKIDCVRLLQELGRNESAQIALLGVIPFARGLSASQCQESDASALLCLAENIAGYDVAVARSIYNLFLALKSSELRLTTAFTDERFYGHQLRLESALATAIGDHRLADELNRQAFELYERLGFRWNAARVALELSSSVSGRYYGAYARAEARRWPKSSLAVWVDRVGPGSSEL